MVGEVATYSMAVLLILMLLLVLDHAYKRSKGKKKAERWMRAHNCPMCGSNNQFAVIEDMTDVHVYIHCHHCKTWREI